MGIEDVDAIVASSQSRRSNSERGAKGYDSGIDGLSSIVGGRPTGRYFRKGLTDSLTQHPSA